MAKKKRKKAAKRKSTTRCAVVTVCGKRRKICRDKKGRITSNRKP
jgi:hypothetical protein